MSPSKIIAGFFQEARPHQKSTQIIDNNKPVENKDAETDKDTEQSEEDKSGKADGNSEPQPTLKNYNCLFVGKRQTYAQLRYTPILKNQFKNDFLKKYIEQFDLF